MPKDTSDRFTQMDNQQGNVIPISKIALDFILLMCVGFPILFLFLWGVPYHRGFFCDDQSLRHPYISSTVPSIYLYIFGLGLNCIVMIIIECLNASPYKQPVYIKGHRIPVWLWQTYCVIGIFAFGAACSQFSTDVMKYTIGRLRPHFYTVCKPNCSDDPLEYITDFVCTNPDYMNDKRIMKEMRLSFPSGHSSFSMYTAMHFVLYLQARMTWDGSKLLKHTLQFLALTAAIFTAMTRVSDYKHHWSDVLAGVVFGVIAACLVVRYVSPIFKEDNRLTGKSNNTEISNLNGNQRV